MYRFFFLRSNKVVQEKTQQTGRYIQSTCDDECIGRN